MSDPRNRGPLPNRKRPLDIGPPNRGPPSISNEDIIKRMKKEKMAKYLFPAIIMIIAIGALIPFIVTTKRYYEEHDKPKKCDEPNKLIGIGALTVIVPVTSSKEIKGLLNIFKSSTECTRYQKPENQLVRLAGILFYSMLTIIGFFIREKIPMYEEVITLVMLGFAALLGVHIFGYAAGV